MRRDLSNRQNGSDKSRKVADAIIRFVAPFSGRVFIINFRSLLRASRKAQKTNANFKVNEQRRLNTLEWIWILFPGPNFNELALYRNESYGNRAKGTTTTTTTKTIAQLRWWKLLFVFGLVYGPAA